MSFVVTRTQRRSIVGVAVAVLLVAVVGLSLSGRARITNEASALPAAEFAAFSTAARSPSRTMRVRRWW